MILRKDLLSNLSSIKHALGGDKSLVPVHPCICFSGELAFSFDDTAAMVVPLKTPWKGAVRGEVLLNWLGAAAGKEVEPTSGQTGGLKLKCGRASAEFPILPEDGFLFDLPVLDKAAKFTLSKEALAALKKVALAMGTDGQHPWRCGVQLLFTEDEVTFYATDDARAARAWEPAKPPKALIGASPLLPPRFVNLLLANAGETVDLQITDDYYAASLVGGVALYSAVPGEPDLATFQAIFKDVPTHRKFKQPLPKTWWGAIARASVLLAGEREAPAEVKIENGKLVITTLSALGASRDSFKFAQPPVSPDKAAPESAEVIARLMPAIAAQLKDQVDSFCIAPGPCFLFFADAFDFVIAAGS